MIGIRYFGPAGRRTGDGDDGLPPEGAWLRAYDPDAHGGRGDATWTLDPQAAMAFVTKVEAMACWRRQSHVKPLRADGMPNRPLTALTVGVEPLPKEQP